MAPYLTPNIMRQAMPAITGDTMGGMARRAVRMGRARIGTIEEEGDAEAQQQLDYQGGHDDDDRWSRSKLRKRSSRNSASV